MSPQGDEALLAGTSFMELDDPRFRHLPPWMWNLGIVLLVILMIVIYARQPRCDDQEIDVFCKGLEQGAPQAEVQKCIESIKR
jgi:hypothetical protein